MSDIQFAAPARAPEAQLRAYLRRIGFSGFPQPNLATLEQLHRLHVEAIAYENLDVQLGRRVTRRPEDAFEKIVVRGRGGWCYEMNGLFAWMLESIGFQVTRLAGGVMREKIGDDAVGNHLVLLVDLGETYVADVGLGFGLTQPVPLRAGAFEQRGFRFALEELGQGWWRFRNHDGAMPPSFDFAPGVTDEQLLEQRCLWLQDEPTSLFRQNAIVQRHFDDHAESLVNGAHKVIEPTGVTTRQIASAEEYEALIAYRFGLPVDGASQVWEAIQARGDSEVEMALA